MTAILASSAIDVPHARCDTASLLREHDWAATPLGAIDAWPSSLRAISAMMLASPVPMSLMCGPDGILLYNDAYAQIAGARHPGVFGIAVNAAWPELADFNAHVMATVLAGTPLSYRDREMVLPHTGGPEKIWVDLDFSPFGDDSGAPIGVVAIVTDRTGRVTAKREIAAQRDRLRIMFDQAPGFIAMMDGPDHVFSVVNQAYNRLMGSRDVVGRTVRDAVPEAVGHGLIRALDSAFATGKPFVANDFRFAIADGQGRVEDHYLDFVYQPIRDADGKICGIFAQGSDVSERVMAEEALRRSRQEYRKLNDALIMANNILSSVPQPKPGPDG